MGAKVLSPVVESAEKDAARIGGMFLCPGCRTFPESSGYHFVRTAPGTKPNNEPVWGWNGDDEKPTFTPSILVNGRQGSPKPRCHSFVTSGRIQFLSDCDHSLAGQTVDLLPWEKDS